MHAHRIHETSGPILENLQNSIRFILDLSANPKRADSIAAGIEASLTMPPASAAPSQDPCAKPSPTTAPLCAQLQLTEAQAAIDYKRATAEAANTLNLAAESWTLAVATYNLTTIEADVTLATAPYTSQTHPGDTPSRTQLLRATHESEIAAALTTREFARAAAASTLTTAAGTLLSAYTTWAAAIATAELTRLTTLAAAHQTFWQALESSLDAVKSLCPKPLRERQKQHFLVPKRA